MLRFDCNRNVGDGTESRCSSVPGAIRSDCARVTSLAVLLIAGLPVDTSVRLKPEAFVDALAGLRVIERWLGEIARETDGPFAANTLTILAELGEVDIQETYRELVPSRTQHKRFLEERALLLGLKL